MSSYDPETRGVAPDDNAMASPSLEAALSFQRTGSCLDFLKRGKSKAHEELEHEDDEDAVLSSKTISEYLSPRETRAIAILRVAVVVTWMLTAVVVSYGVYWLSVESQFDGFRAQFQKDAGKVLESFHLTIDKRLAAVNTLATAITAHAIHSNSSFPFVTLPPDFVVAGNNARILADSVLINWLPLVTDDTRAEWEQYAFDNRHQADQHFAMDARLRLEEDVGLGHLGTRDLSEQPAEELLANTTGGEETVPNNIPMEFNFVLQDGSNYHPRIWSAETFSIIPDGSGLYLPLWHMSPVTALKQIPLNTDLGRMRALEGILPYLARQGKPRGALLHKGIVPHPNVAAQATLPIAMASQFRHSVDNYEDAPTTSLAYPVFDSFEEDSKFVGMLTLALNWRLQLRDILRNEDSWGLICVVENSFGQVFSFRIDGPEASYLGEGDPLLNDDGFIYGDLVATHASENRPIRAREQRLSYTTMELGEEYSQYRLRIYPTQDTYANHRTSEPIVSSFIVAAIFGLAAIVFFLYDFFVQKRQRAMMVAGIKQARKAAVAEREMNEYLAHEIRNPLSAALSACSFVSSAVNEAEPLQDEESRREVRDDVLIISSSLKFINDMLRNILDLHRAVNQQVRIKKEDADLYHDVLEPVASMLYNRDYNFEVIVDCPSNLVVETDALRLKQVVLNLGRNAAKFVQKGFVRLKAKTVTDSEGWPSSVQIQVEDSGPGIPRDKRTALFAKFQESLDLLSQGTGIGLSLCKQLVDAMGGELWLDESYDSGVEGFPGTRFVVDLKTKPSTHSYDDEMDPEKGHISRRASASYCSNASEEGTASMTHHTSTKSLHADDFPSSPRRRSHAARIKNDGTVEDVKPLYTGSEELSVLFVDDDMVLRKLFSRSIKRVFPGWKIQQAASGESAIRLVEAGETFDLIFMDQYMASTEKQLLGTETVRELRAKGVESKICGLSANDSKKAFLSAGADGFILKPIPLKKEELETALSPILLG